MCRTLQDADADVRRVVAAAASGAQSPHWPAMREKLRPCDDLEPQSPVVRAALSQHIWSSDSGVVLMSVAAGTELWSASP